MSKTIIEGIAKTALLGPSVPRTEKPFHSH